MPKRCTTKKFKKMVYDLVGNRYTVIGKYKNVRTPIKMKRNIKPCKIFTIYPHTFLKDRGYHQTKRNRSRQLLFQLRVKKGTHGKYSVVGIYKGVNVPILMRYNSSNISHSHKFYITPHKFLVKHSLYRRTRMTTAKFKYLVHYLVGNKYTVLGSVINMRSKVKMRHNTKHPHTFYMSADCFLRGERCPKCFGTHKSSTKKFKNRVYKLVGSKYTVLGKYTNCMTPIKMRFNSKIPHTFYMTPQHFLNGERFRSIHSRRMASILFKEEVYKLVGNKYTVIGKYVNQHKKILMRHNTRHPHLFLMTPTHFLEGDRCPICFGNTHRTTSEFKHDVYKLVGDKFTVIGQYINNNKPIKMRHNTKHPHDFYIAPYSFLTNPHCTLCDDSETPWTTELFKLKVYELVGNKYTVLGKYINVHKPIKMRHNTKHPHNFYITPNAFINGGQRCTICAMRQNESWGERVINNYLKNVGLTPKVDYVYGYHLHTYSYCHKKLHADFYFPKYRAVIEFDGQQHDKPCNFFGGIPALISQRNRDNLKNDYCFEHDILIVRIKDYAIHDKGTKAIAYQEIKYYLPLIKLVHKLRVQNACN